MRKIELPEKEIVAQYSAGTSVAKLARRYRVSRETIAKRLRVNSVTIKRNQQLSRKYFPDEDFFDHVDSEAKAYILGLLYADGHNSPERHSVIISLEEHDRSLLEKVSAAIYRKPRPLLRYEGCKKKGPSGKLITCRPSYKLIVTSKKLSEQAAFLGIVKAKTRKIVFPSWLGASEMPHFIRGYFDGDGSITLNKRRKNAVISITSNIRFCRGLKRALTCVLEIHPHIKKHASTGISIVVIRRQGDVLSFLAWIYAFSTIRMERKYAKYLQYTDMRKDIINKHTCCRICGAPHHAKGMCGYHYRHEYYLHKKKRG